MKLQIKYPLVFALLCFWFGIVLSISFLETPFKFFVPGITLPVALGLGKIMFGISTSIQLGIVLIIILNLILYKEKLSRPVMIITALLAIILLLEKFWMLPVLDARADALIAGKPMPPTLLHDYFIYAESIKVALILAGIFIQITKKQKIKSDFGY